MTIQFVDNGKIGMDRTVRYTNILQWFRENMPEASTELVYGNPFELLVAVILSAQCTDKRVNMVTPALFAKFPDPVSMAEASVEDIYGMIKSVSFPNSKAAHLSSMSRMLAYDFGSVVPDSVEELMKLPGVGRKTANVIASVVYGAPVIAVDTHVFRVSNRTGLSDGKTPEEVERDLTVNIPENLRAIAHHWLILHGRYVCTARKPRCADCGIRDFCRKYQEETR